jgi:hypothetical protein
MNTKPTAEGHNRAVSDVVGYVLIFSLITVSVGVITVGGFSTLEDRQDAERINNAERALDVFATNVENVYRGGAPSRATEMRLSGGTLRYGEQINITVADADNPDTNITVRIDPIIYQDGRTKLVYINGAILRSDSNSAVMLREPPFRLDSQRVLMPLIATGGVRETESISAEGTLRIRIRAARPTPIPVPGMSSTNTVDLTVDSPRSDAWQRYFERQVELDTTNAEIRNDGRTLRINNVEHVSTPLSPIEVRFER